MKKAKKVSIVMTSRALQIAAKVALPVVVVLFLIYIAHHKQKKQIRRKEKMNRQALALKTKCT